ncbi:MAG: hypothetical protein KIS66_09240 [Fimbriimonadaceae bacterium]|nr:hypothetical protein [Fimbriimonadaceae bacterium]
MASVASPSFVPLPVVRDGGRAYLQGLQGWLLSEMGNSMVAAASVACRAVGFPTDYQDLLGYSGQAFRIQVHDQLCPSSPHSNVGYQTAPLLREVLPVALDGHPVRPESLADTRARVKEAIEQGRPALWHHFESGLVVGYENGGESWIRVHPYTWSVEPFVNDAESPFDVEVVRPRVVPVHKRAAFLRSLESAVAMWDSAPVGHYLLGRAAWEFLVQWVDDHSLDGDRHGCFWIVDQLMEGRAAAEAFLRRRRDWFPARRRAIDGAIEALGQFSAVVHPGGACAVSLVAPAWAEKDGHTFGPSGRDRLLHTLCAARQHDARAMEALREATVL